jgi:hypothetical protein
LTLLSFAALLREFLASHPRPAPSYLVRVNTCLAEQFCEAFGALALLLGPLMFLLGALACLY